MKDHRKFHVFFIPTFSYYDILHEQSMLITNNGTLLIVKVKSFPDFLSFYPCLFILIASTSHLTCQILFGPLLSRLPLVVTDFLIFFLMNGIV